jgi:allantoin racemase
MLLLVLAGRYDAVVIDCATDPELEEAKSLVNIPVVGALEAPVHLASMLARRFSLIVHRKARLHHRQDKVRSYGLEHKVASYRVAEVEYPSEQVIQDLMIKDPQKLSNIIRSAFHKALQGSVIEAARAAVERDGAGAILLDCTIFSSFGEELRKMSTDLGVPVIDPLLASLRVAETLAEIKS